MKLALLPGMDGTGELFREFVAALPAGFETEIVRYPGDVIATYGMLMAVVEAMTQGNEPYVLVAESYSTPLAIAFAAKCGRNLAGVVLCAGFATSPVGGWMHDWMTMMPVYQLRVPRWAVRYFLVGDGAPKELVIAVQESVGWVEPAVLAARVREVLRCDVRASLAGLRMPVLYLRATEDRLVRVECVEEILRILPGTAVTAIDGPHLLLQREAKVTADVVVGFVRGLG